MLELLHNVCKDQIEVGWRPNRKGRISDKGSDTCKGSTQEEDGGAGGHRNSIGAPQRDPHKKDEGLN